MFSKNKSDILPKRRKGDYRIELDKGYIVEELKYNPLYKMSLEEAEAYRKYIIENLTKGFIKSSYVP
jgi:hypothetical protein